LRHTFAKAKLRRLYEERAYTAGYDRSLVRAYRKRVQLMAAARDERDLYAMKSLRFEKLKGKRSHQRPMRLNDQYRLIVELTKGPEGSEVLIRDIEDYH
jgi:proteic killer suppression protein